jgi:hypothetical protein
MSQETKEADSIERAPERWMEHGEQKLQSVQGKES